VCLSCFFFHQKSHLGVDSWPELEATQDTNEMTTPLTPFVKSIDAFNPSDNAIRIVSSGGVTSALVLPGRYDLITHLVCS
jgi:imidazolonepropionase-like amidohydrolase